MMSINLELTEQAARAVLALRMAPEFRTLIEWIEQQRDKQRAMNDDELAEHLIRQQQGAVQTLNALLTIEARSVEFMNVKRARQDPWQGRGRLS